MRTPLHYLRKNGFELIFGDDDSEEFIETYSNNYSTLLYMDPPYNHRQYCANYHVLETIARYDNPELRGVTGLRSFGNQKSAFCLKKQALPALEEMIRKTKARFVFLSYNTEGIMRKGEIEVILTILITILF